MQESIENKGSLETTPLLDSIKMIESIKYIISLAISCNPRGGLSLEDSVKLHTLNEENKTILVNDDITFLKTIIFRAQSNGVLSLKEAWTVYNAFYILENQDK